MGTMVHLVHSRSMTWPIAFLCLASLFSIGPAFSASPEWVTIGRGVRAFHEDVLAGQRIRLEPAVTVDASYLVQLMGIQNAGKINSLRVQIRRSPGLKNAIGYSGDGYRTIVFDPVWAQTARPEFLLALAHEAGHFYCGHEDLPQSPKIELEADRFAGASIKRLERYTGHPHFDAVLSAALERYPVRGTTLYPSRSDRVAAIRDGYEHGSPCGNLSLLLNRMTRRPLWPTAIS